MADDAVTTTDEATEGFSYCSVPQAPERTFGPDVGPARMELIQETEKKWVNGTVLHYYFFNEETEGGYG